MSTLRKSLLTMLKGIDLGKASTKAKAEVTEALKTIKKPEVIIDDTENHQKKIAQFFAYMFGRFPELKTDKNRALLHQWTGIAKENVENIVNKVRKR